MVRVQVTAGRCGSGPPLLLPVTRWPIPWSLDRTVAGDTFPSWGLCLRPHSQPLQEPQGSASRPLRPLHRPLTHQGSGSLQHLPRFRTRLVF